MLLVPIHSILIIGMVCIKLFASLLNYMVIKIFNSAYHYSLYIHADNMLGIIWFSNVNKIIQ